MGEPPLFGHENKPSYFLQKTKQLSRHLGLFEGGLTNTQTQLRRTAKKAANRDGICAPDGWKQCGNSERIGKMVVVDTGRPERTWAKLCTAQETAALWGRGTCRDRDGSARCVSAPQPDGLHQLLLFFREPRLGTRSGRGARAGPGSLSHGEAWKPPPSPGGGCQDRRASPGLRQGRLGPHAAWRLHCPGSCQGIS